MRIKVLFQIIVGICTIAYAASWFIFPVTDWGIWETISIIIVIPVMISSNLLVWINEGYIAYIIKLRKDGYLLFSRHKPTHMSACSVYLKSGQKKMVMYDADNHVFFTSMQVWPASHVYMWKKSYGFHYPYYIPNNNQCS